MSKFQPTKKQRRVLKKVRAKNFTSPSVLESNDVKDSSTDEIFISIILEEASFTKEKFELYKKYQSNVHFKESEKYSEEDFTNFLVKSPLYADESEKKRGEQTLPFGTMHQLYRIENVWIMFNVWYRIVDYVIERIFLLNYILETNCCGRARHFAKRNIICNILDNCDSDYSWL